MRAQVQKVNLEKISFETGDQSIQLQANIQEGNLSFKTDIFIDYSELNNILNHIQKELSNELEVSSLFESEKMYDGNLFYQLDLTKNINKSIEIQNVIYHKEFKRIRA